jgi:MFS family permease
MALANFVFTLRFLPESLSTEARARASAAGGFSPRLLGQVITGPAGFLFALTFLVTFGFSALEQSFSFYLLSVGSFGVTPTSQPVATGLILGLAGLTGVLIQGGLIGRLVARFGEGAIARAGIALMMLGFVLFPLPRALWALVAGPMLLLSIGRALTAPALSALVSRKANLGQGLTLSTSQSFDALARTVGPITAGGLFHYLGPAAPYVVSAFVMAGALVLTLVRRTQMDAAAPAPPMPGDSPVATADAITATASGVATER